MLVQKVSNKLKARWMICDKKNNRCRYKNSARKKSAEKNLRAKIARIIFSEQQRISFFIVHASVSGQMMGA